MDPWYAAGSHDMLEVAHMGLHVAQMTGTAQARSVYDAITVNPARALNLVNYGLSVGCNADMVILQAADPIEAIRLRATRLFVIRRGKIISKTPTVKSEVEMLGATQQITFAQTEIP
jgi:cytosine deaminase